jgi:hypothetical protein
MVKLQKSNKLGRKLRKDAWSELGISTLSLVEEAILVRDDEQALKLLDYLYVESKTFHDFTSDWWAALITYVGCNFGEEEVEKTWRGIASHTPLGSAAALGSTEERVYIGAELWRGHCLSDDELRVTEYEDRYEFLLNPCPTGGRMRKEGRLEPPYNFCKTSKPYPWSWTRTGIPWYCIHCSLCRGIMSVEAYGYFVRVHEYPEESEAAKGQCRLIYYKKPSLIPEKYFGELGLTKDPHKFKATGDP